MGSRKNGGIGAWTPRDIGNVALQLLKGIRRGMNRLLNWFLRLNRYAQVACVVSLMAVLVLIGYGISESNESYTVSLKMEDIGELATQEVHYRNVQVISDFSEIFGLEIPGTRNKYIFSYDGVIKAGINFEKVAVLIDRKAKDITIVLPEPYIISNDLDENSLIVYDEQWTIFNPLSLEDMRASYEALEEQAEADAVENGLYENAIENAKALIEGFLKAAVPDLESYAVQYR